MGTGNCEARYPDPRPPVPYGKQQNVSEALWFEDGFKECVGYLTEGRYLVFEASGHALANPGDSSNNVTATPATSNHDDKRQRWVIHYSDGEESGIFTVSSALDGRWLGASMSLLPASDHGEAAPLRIRFLGNGKGYSLQYANATTDVSYITINEDGQVALEPTASGSFTAWSVTYHD